MSGKVKQWIVGSSPSCNLLVSVPTVSSKHCRLTRQDASMQVEDVGSTNGTFVDGVRIESATSINPTSRVTLGTMIPLPWPEAETAERVITIGRADDNDVVIEAANVSTYHARLIVGPFGTLVVEDLASTNGTWIMPGSGLEDAPAAPAEPELQRILRCASVGPEDQIYLGSTPINVSDLLSPGGPRAVIANGSPNNANADKSQNIGHQAPAPMPIPAPSPAPAAMTPSYGPDFGSIRSQLQTSEIAADETSPLPAGRNYLLEPSTDSSFPFRRTIIALACLLAATITLFGIAAAIKKLPFGGQSATAAVDSGDNSENADNEPKQTIPPQSNVVAKTVPDPTAETMKTEAASTPFESLHWVLVSQGTPKKFFRVGTAWSPDGKVLLTSTGVLIAMETLMKSEGAGAEGEVQVVHAASGRVHKVLRWGSNSKFEDQIAKLNETDKAIGQKMAPYRIPSEGDAVAQAPKEVPAAVRSEILELQKRKLDEQQAAACYDVGWIRIEPPTMAPKLPINGKSELRPKQKLRIVSAPVDIQDPFYDQASLFEPQGIDCRVDMLVKPPGVNHSRLVANCEFVVGEFNLFGSPIVNEKNEVVAMLVNTSSNNAEPANQSETKPGNHQIDGVLAVMMTELLEEIETR